MFWLGFDFIFLLVIPVTVSTTLQIEQIFKKVWINSSVASIPMKYTTAYTNSHVFKCGALCSRTLGCVSYYVDASTCYLLDRCNLEGIGTINVDSFWLLKNQEVMCLVISKYGYSQSEGKTFCQSHKGEILNMKNSRSEKLVDLQKLTLTDASYWMGGNDINDEGEWMWEDETPMGSIEGWQEGQPNNHNYRDGEDCVVIKRVTFEYVDRPCSEHHRVICDLGLRNKLQLT